MRKIVFLLMAALFLSSCVNEFWPGSSKTIGIKVVDIHATKTTVINEHKQQLLFSTPLDIDGLEDCYLEAWISDTEPSIATKGVQVTTDNIFSAQGDLMTYAYSNGEIYKNDELSLEKIPVVFDGETWKFKDSSGENDKEYFWPDEGDLTFCSYSPKESAVTGFNYEDSKVHLSYTYTSPDDDPNNDAVNQKDFMVGCDVDQNRHQNHGDATIHLCHGLTSVRFLNGEIKNLTVESVTLENFYSSGTVEFNTTDDEKRLGHFEWTPTGSVTSFTQTFNTAFDGEGKNSAGTTNFDMTDGQSCTFMVIPQDFRGRAEGKDAKILIKTNREIHPVIELNLSKITEKSIWTEGLSEEDRIAEAGQLIDWSKYAGRTITFRVGPKEISKVSIALVGDMSADKADDGLKVKNLGTRPVYARAFIVVNTIDNNGKIYYSFPNENLVESSNDFVSSNVSAAISGDNWTLNKVDGYWYYKSDEYNDLIQSGEEVPFIHGFGWNNLVPYKFYVSEETGSYVFSNEFLQATVLVQGVYDKPW